MEKPQQGQLWHFDRWTLVDVTTPLFPNYKWHLAQFTGEAAKPDKLHAGRTAKQVPWMKWPRSKGSPSEDSHAKGLADPGGAALRMSHAQSSSKRIFIGSSYCILKHLSKGTSRVCKLSRSLETRAAVAGEAHVVRAQLDIPHGAEGGPPRTGFPCAFRESSLFGTTGETSFALGNLSPLGDVLQTNRAATCRPCGGESLPVGAEIITYPDAVGKWRRSNKPFTPIRNNSPRVHVRRSLAVCVTSIRREGENLPSHLKGATLCPPAPPRLHLSNL